VSVKRSSWLLVALAIAVGVIAIWMGASSGTSRADTTSREAGPAPAAQVAGASIDHARPHLTIGPPEYQALAENDEHPGETALRAYTDDFMANQADAVKEHVAHEKISMEETRELTYFAFVARTSLDWDAVETVTGHPIAPNARSYAARAMLDASADMTAKLRDQVAAGAPDADRWQTIHDVEQSYLDRYYQLTGMTPELLDWLEWDQAQHQQVSADIDSAAEQPAAPAMPGVRSIDRHLGQPQAQPTK